MSTFTALSAKERELFFRQYMQHRPIDPIIVEKDFWVCWLLGRIFEIPALADTCLFKGGTSLSKVFRVIERFSEDIDIGITPSSLGWKETDLDDAPSRTRRDERNTLLEKACAEVVQSTWKPLLEQRVQSVLGPSAPQTEWLSFKVDKASHSPVLLFAYPGVLPRGVVSSYIAREVKIEFGSLTDQRPTGRHLIQAFISEIVPAAFTDLRTEVVALELERTFWEKVTILHAEYHRPADKPLRDRYARHYADFAALWRHPSSQSARLRFDLLERVRIHKSRFFSSSWANYSAAKPGTLRLCPPEARIKELSLDYEAMRQMFLGDPLPFEEIIKILREAESTFNRT